MMPKSAAWTGQFNCWSSCKCGPVQDKGQKLDRSSTSKAVASSALTCMPTLADKCSLLARLEPVVSMKECREHHCLNELAHAMCATKAGFYAQLTWIELAQMPQAQAMPCIVPFQVVIF
eukprot:1158966-Pelagomonas_calceolata.AAC.3